MRVVKVKSSKHSDVIMGGDAHMGPTQVNVVTRVRPTVHGDLFKDLIKGMSPGAMEMVDRAISHNGTDPHQTAARIAKGMVLLAERITMDALEVMQRNPALAVNIPSYDSLMQRLRGADLCQPADSPNVVSLSERQEKDHE